ncbi:MAG: radical SAM protein [Clostridia bacterium]|nr:radical SAM protein [Clostridia bacterium]
MFAKNLSERDPYQVPKYQHDMEKAAFGVVIDKLLKKMDQPEHRTELYLQLIKMLNPFFAGKDGYEKYFDRMKEVASDPDSRWMRFINSTIDELDPHVLRTILMNFGYEHFLNGTRAVRKNRELFGCHIPYVILFDPTTACNMHCEGCWSGTYGHKDNMPYDTMNKIVVQGKALGIHAYLMTGGEPMVRKNDIFRLAEEHDDCMFFLFTNSSLITEEVCDECVRLGNIVFFLSIEGTPETNDARRGAGHYNMVMKAMDLLREHGLLFGTSICYTRANIEAVTSDEFFQMLEEKGARFGFFFHYMPVGSNAVPELMPTPDQRLYMIDRIREIRSSESQVRFFPMDFQNDAEFIGGCIAAGRDYFHINAHGDAEPCVFIHYSDRNIYDNSILEMLQGPLFRAYREGQPFNDNMLQPCPMLENPQILRSMVKRTGAHDTNLESEESVDHLCDKCEDYAAKWQPAADDYWQSHRHFKPVYKGNSKRSVLSGVKIK